MATTHVFIVDTNTFKYHLEYLFAGTGAKDNVIDFNNSANSKLYHTTENNLVSMIADSQRVRKGDYVIFYLQQNFRDGISEGKFYGIFKIKHDLSFLDNLSHKTSKISLSKKHSDFEYPSKEGIFRLKWKNGLEHEIEMRTALTQKQKKKLLKKFEGSDSDQKIITTFIRNFYSNNQYLLEDLTKSLTFRCLLEPFEIYPVGVTEWEALDEIKHIQSPNQMLWSLIYRKLKGNRGNTMITIYETDRLFQLIRNKNKSKQLSGKSFTFNKNTQQIEVTNKIHNYKGRKEKINILPRLINKYNQNKAFEPHLQAYIVQNIGKNTNESLDNCLIPRDTRLE